MRFFQDSGGRWINLATVSKLYVRNSEGEWQIAYAAIDPGTHIVCKVESREEGQSKLDKLMGWLLTAETDSYVSFAGWNPAAEAAPDRARPLARRKTKE